MRLQKIDQSIDNNTNVTMKLSEKLGGKLKGKGRDIEVVEPSSSSSKINKDDGPSQEANKLLPSFSPRVEFELEFGCKFECKSGCERKLVINNGRTNRQPRRPTSTYPTTLHLGTLSLSRMKSKVHDVYLHHAPTTH